MAKKMVGYCGNCGCETKHEVLEAEDSVPWRVFETIVTMGLALLTPHDYKCECTRCGKINTLTKG